MKHNYTDTQLQAAALSQLRPLAEAGPVPEGCVRVTGYKSQHSKTGWVVTDFTYHGVTHFTDIRLPEPAEADPYAELKAAHAEGKVIEARLINTPLPYGWIVSESPVWDSNCEYRIKPEPETFEPTPEPLVTKPISLPTVDGMSLRDWFAGQALAMLADPDFDHSPEDTARLVYRIADAMLKAREVKP